MSIRLIINEILFSYESLTLDEIETIVRSVVLLEDSRNDDLVITTYPFRHSSLYMRIINWTYWSNLIVIFVICLLSLIGVRLYLKYHRFIKKKQKQLLIDQEESQKLKRIVFEEDEKTYHVMKDKLIKEAERDPNLFSLNLEKWIEMMNKSDRYIKNPTEIYEKVVNIVLYVDSKKPTLTYPIIQQLNDSHVKEIMSKIESTIKINPEKSRINITEFYNDFLLDDTLFGGKITSSNIIDNTFNEKEKKQLFDIESDHLLSLLIMLNWMNWLNILNENDAVGAFILSYCNQSLISEITSRLTKDKLLSVVSNLVHVRKPSSDLLNQFEYVLKDRLLVGKNKVPPKMNVPLHTATSVFETLPNDVRMTIFSSLEQQSPELVQTIQSEILHLKTLPFYRMQIFKLWCLN